MTEIKRTRRTDNTMTKIKRTRRTDNTMTKIKRTRRTDNTMTKRVIVNDKKDRQHNDQNNRK